MPLCGSLMQVPTIFVRPSQRVWLTGTADLAQAMWARGIGISEQKALFVGEPRLSQDLQLQAFSAAFHRNAAKWECEHTPPAKSYEKSEPPAQGALLTVLVSPQCSKLIWKWRGPFDTAICCLVPSASCHVRALCLTT